MRHLVLMIILTVLVAGIGVGLSVRTHRKQEEAIRSEKARITTEKLKHAEDEHAAAVSFFESHTKHYADDVRWLEDHRQLEPGEPYDFDDYVEHLKRIYVAERVREEWTPKIETLSRERDKLQAEASVLDGRPLHRPE